MKQIKNQNNSQNNGHNSRDEQLSALLDDALDDQQLQGFMQDLKRDPLADAEKAQRYQLMGDAMRDDLDRLSFVDISAAVHRAVELEPEQPVEQSVEHIVHNSSPPVWSTVRSTVRSGIYGWFKPLGGMAVAASVAMVTLLTFNSLQISSKHTDERPGLAQSQPIQLVNPEIARNVRVASTRGIEQKSPEQQQQLNRYMLRHSGIVRHTAIQKMMPYERAVEFNAEEKK
ncbi:hypothetical protein MNBD_GAMMA10-348 [hydrothermal vent metagenome]|uniref:Anti sigma-E protein RseA N-terminal domain-containing protein n=1 Tax=hydrothermal vent metagenome TaxID=652676 RepID=A0A3B0XYM3_9ZZZZ